MNSRLVNLAGPDYIEATYGPMVRHLGSGTGGSVALHGFKSSSTYVAVKSYSFPAHTTFAQRLRHVESEARVALSMNQANVIRTHEFCFELTPSGTASRDGTLLKTGTFYAVMDYCVTDMFEYINRRDLSPQAIESVFVQLVAGVHHMHTVHRVAHRDIKLDNIGVAADGSIKLIDFGCARILPPGSDYTRGACGSEPYIPMEAILSYPTTSAHTSAAVHAAYQQLCYDAFKVDVWSIAVVFLALLSRHFPWSAARVTDANFAMYLEHGSHALDHWLRDPAAPLIKRMLAIDPAERPSISEVIADPWFQSLINSSNSNSSSKSRTA
ncbi:kinase-like protein [Ramicandelaber brevisporus]|nr:kinase-like protein [Ramicandelaber brevisporus]